MKSINIFCKVENISELDSMLRLFERNGIMHGNLKTLQKKDKKKYIKRYPLVNVWFREVENSPPSVGFHFTKRYRHMHLNILEREEFIEQVKQIGLTLALKML